MLVPAQAAPSQTHNTWAEKSAQLQQPIEHENVTAAKPFSSAASAVMEKHGAPTAPTKQEKIFTPTQTFSSQIHNTKAAKSTQLQQPIKHENVTSAKPFSSTASAVI